MTNIEVTSELRVDLIRAMADDDFVIQAAKASAIGANEISENVNRQRFIKALMDPRHGVPWEHTYFTFFVEVPIFVARQWVKHRLSSMNEVSGRYKKLLPKFYSPGPERPLVNQGTKMKPRFDTYDDDIYAYKAESDYEVFSFAWEHYQNQIEAGVAEEMARTVLPVATFTQFYWSLNARSLLNFLERRVDSPDNRVETHPQYEIDVAAQGVEKAFALAMPYSHEAFVNAGRVAP